MSTIEKKIILLVDDNEFHLSLAETILEDEYKIIKARSGKEAIEYFLKGIVVGDIPNLILLDILMPEMDGWETYHKLRGISILQDIPIAFLTSVSGVDEEKQAYEIGVADFITKPYLKDDLLKRVETIIKKAK